MSFWYDSTLIFLQRIRKQTEIPQYVVTFDFNLNTMQNILKVNFEEKIIVDKIYFFP